MIVPLFQIKGPTASGKYHLVESLATADLTLIDDLPNKREAIRAMDRFIAAFSVIERQSAEPAD
ncbi:MAG: hypothetical protein JO353_13040 [Phycisphaerae bacterium]|nr:hypothetical protein [Phycisphaerae bacterium]